MEKADIKSVLEEKKAAFIKSLEDDGLATGEVLKGFARIVYDEAFLEGVTFALKAVESAFPNAEEK